MTVHLVIQFGSAQSAGYGKAFAHGVLGETVHRGDLPEVKVFAAFQFPCFYGLRFGERHFIGRLGKVVQVPVFTSCNS